MSSDFFRRLRPINNYDEKAIWDALNSQTSYNNYAGSGPFGGNLYRISMQDPSNNYISKDVYVEVRSMGGYPYIAGVYEEEEEDSYEEEQYDYYEEEDYDEEEEDASYEEEQYEEEEDYNEYDDGYEEDNGEDQDGYYEEEDYYGEDNGDVQPDPFGVDRHNIVPSVIPPPNPFNDLLKNYFDLINHSNLPGEDDEEDYYEEDRYYDDGDEEDDRYP